MDPFVTVVITEACLVRGESCDIGDEVEVLPHQAAQMVALGRAKYPEDAPSLSAPEVVEVRDPAPRKRAGNKG